MRLGNVAMTIAVAAAAAGAAAAAQEQAMPALRAVTSKPPETQVGP